MNIVLSRSTTKFLIMLAALAGAVPGFAAITITGTPPQGTVGVPYTFSFTAAGGTAPYTFSASPDVPPGLTLGSAGNLTGTPSVAFQNYTVTISVTDSAATPATATKNVTFQIGSATPASTLAIQPSIPTGNVGQDYFGTIQASGGTLPYTWQISGLPSGLSAPGGVTFSPSITGTPAAAGTFQVNVQVTDSSSPPVTAQTTVTLKIASFVITTTSLPAGTVGAAYSQSIQTTGGTGPYTFAGGPPFGLGLTLSSSGTLSGTPTQTATVSFNVQVVDAANLFAEKTVSLTINPSGSSLTISTTSLAEGVVGTAYAQSISVSGGASPYSFSITDGSLPPGLTLNAATGAITGTPNTPTFSNQFTIQVSDKNGLRASRNFVLNVSAAPLTITTASLPAASLNAPYSQTITTSGGTAPVYFYSGNLPTGFELSSTGVLTGTPTTAGTFAITLTAFDSSTPQVFVSKNLNLVVSNTPALTISTASPLPNGTAGTAYSQTFAAAGGTAPYTFTLSTGALPAGLSLSSTGALTGTPTASGASNFTIQVKDSQTATGTKSFALTIDPGPPTITTANLPDGSVDQAYTATLAAAGGSGQFTFALAAGSSLPSGLQLGSTGIVAGTPTIAGTSTFTVTVTDTSSTLSSSKQFTLKINGSPIVITTPATLPTGTAGVPYRVTFSTTGGTGTGKSFTTSDPAPPGLAFDATSLSGTPTTAGSYTLTLTFSDQGSVPVSKAFTLVVNPAGLAITNSSPLAPGTVGTAYSLTLNAIAGTTPYTFAVSSGSLPTGLTLSPAGAITGTPTVAGQFTFSIRVTDSASINATQDFTLNIAAAPLTFTTTSLSAALVGSAYSQIITVTGGTQPYTFGLSSGNLPNGLTLSPSGTLSGTPATPGNFGFIVTATDKAGVVAARSFSIAVSNAGLMISTVSPLPSGSIGTTYQQTINAMGGTQPYTYTVTAGALPAGLTLSPAGLISGKPTSAGSSNFTVTVTDNEAKAASMAFTLVIATSATDLAITTPSALLSGVVNSVYQQAISAVGGSAPYTFQLISGALPSGLTMNSSGTVSGTPTAGGNFGFTVQVTDSAAGSAAKAFTVTIGSGGVVFATSSLSDGTIGANYSQTLAAAGGTPPYRFVLNTGNLPPGLALNQSGALSGTPTTAGTYSFAVLLSDSLGASTTKTLSITIGGGTAMTISTTSPLPVAIMDAPYSQTFSVRNGLPPYTWSITGGALPSGLTLSTDGVLSGSSLVAGTFNFTVRVVDYFNVTATSSFSLTVALPGSNGGIPVIGAITNSASYGVGAVAPGEIVTIFGSNMGPATLATATTTVPGMVDTTLANTRVLFDGIPAPLVYVSDKQISAVVPYEVARAARTSVQVEYKGSQSAIFTTGVTDSAPGIFSANASGSGPGAILNQDYTVNSSANPAAPGSVVILYATGEGQTDPQGVDGKIVVDVLPRPMAPVTVLVGGLPAQVLYAGGAPGIVAGGMQINVLLPKDVPTGAEVVVLLQVGTKASQNFVTVAIR